MITNKETKQAGEDTTAQDTIDSMEFHAVSGIVESEDGNIIIVKEEPYDITGAMLIDENRKNIFKKGYAFRGKEVLILHRYERVLSVVVLSPGTAPVKPDSTMFLC